MCASAARKKPYAVKIDFLLGSVLLLKKNYLESEKLFKKYLSSNPNNADAINNLGVIHIEHYKDFKTAEKYFQKALAHDPLHINAMNNLGNAYLKLGQADAAEPLYRKSLTLNPNNPIAMHNLGTVLFKRGQFEEASRHLWKTLEFWPESQETYIKLGDALNGKNDVAQCIDLMKRIMGLRNPGLALFFAYSVAKRICQWELIEKIRPDVLNLMLHNETVSRSLQMIVMELLSDSAVDNKTLFAVHRATAEGVERLLEAAPCSDYAPALQPRGRLRIGYLSGDFRGHVASHYIRGLVNRHDRSRFEIYCYSNTPQEDNITEQYKAKVDAFINVCPLTDVQLAQRIHDDGVQILVDLNGYTRDSRIHVMSYRPAPIQMTYMGYPYSSGLKSIDYIVSDPYLDGPLNAKYCSETPLRLPESFVSFGNLFEQSIDSTLPFERNQYITFGSLANSYKLNPDVIRVWAAVLKRIPFAKMVLNHPNYAPDIARENILNEFAKHGITAERLQFVWDKHPSGTHLRYYNDIDIHLDTFPLTGGQTTVDAVWMGVPVVTLVGDTHHQRLSYSILNNIGINVEELAAFTQEDYVDKAVALANRPERIKELRRLIPATLKDSILCDPARFTRQMEDLYIEMWNKKFNSHSFSDRVQPQEEYVPIHGAVELAVSSSLEDSYSYIVREQGGWYDLEYRFVCDSVQVGMRVVDVNPGIGMYAIPLAKKIAGKGALWAFPMTDSDRQWVQKSSRHNRISNLHIFARDPTTLGLDEERPALGLNDIHFVRVNLTGDLGADFLRRSKAFFSDNSPLVMFGIKSDSGIDLSLVPLFKDLGYEVYRLIPGLNLLAPYTSPEDLDVFATNLFVCKADQADYWAGRNLLIRRAQPLAALPTVHENHWQDYLKALPYAKDLIPGWLNSYVQVQEWEVYHVALNLFALAKTSEADAAHRYACLQACFSILVMLNQAHPSLPRLLSLTRVMIEMGKREQAVNMLSQLVEFFQADTVVNVDEPFLVLSDDFAAMNPGGKLGDWIVASVIGQRELSRALSTYFLGQESLEMLRVVQGTGFCSKELERRLQLLEIRHAPVNETSSQVS